MGSKHARNLKLLQQRLGGFETQGEVFNQAFSQSIWGVRLWVVIEVLASIPLEVLCIELGAQYLPMMRLNKLLRIYLLPRYKHLLVNYVSEMGLQLRVSIQRLLSPFGRFDRLSRTGICGC